MPRRRRSKLSRRQECTAAWKKHRSRNTSAAQGGNLQNSAQAELSFSAHLCEVLRLDPPQESNRNRTWFSSADTKRNLREDRDRDYGAKLARVVDRAVDRIQRLGCAADKLIAAPRELIHGVISIDNGRRARVSGKASGTGLTQLGSRLQSGPSPPGLGAFLASGFRNLPTARYA